VLVGLDVAATLVDVQVDVEVAVVLQREQMVRRFDDAPAVTGPASVRVMCRTTSSTSSARISVNDLRLAMIWWTSSTTPGMV
jgi:hypothetical protein